MFTKRKKAAEEICRHFSVDVYYHPLCGAPEDTRDQCPMHSTEEGMTGCTPDANDLKPFVLHRCDRLKEMCDNLGHLPAELAFRYSAQLSTDKLAALTIGLENQKTRINAKIGRNEPCPCGSGKKYKICCGQ